ncbi:MAG: asparagine--tRNA ligase, partial [Erysipelotrichaceae bacterium]|nr:asparagine--tRNA ligase [Erysipelotrichaceae bacterium]
MKTLPMTNLKLFQQYQAKKHPLLKSEQLLTGSGWIKNNRDNGSIGFIELNDGTTYKNIQLVYGLNTKQYEMVSHLRIGAAISYLGVLKYTPEAKQPFEIHVSDVMLLGDSDEDYPMQKKRHSYEFLRDFAHLRMRTNTFNALFRVRSVLATGFQEFF